MSVIKQLATYNGSAWTTDDIGANASNVSLTTNVAGQSNVQSALSKLCGTSALTASRMVVTNSSNQLTTNTPTPGRALVSAASTGIPTASTVTSTELGYLSGVTSNVQTQINTLNNNFNDKFGQEGYLLYLDNNTATPYFSVDSDGNLCIDGNPTTYSILKIKGSYYGREINVGINQTSTIGGIFNPQEENWILGHNFDQNLTYIQTGGLILEGHNSKVGTLLTASNTSAISLPTTTAKAVASISLPAGSWVVNCRVSFPYNNTGARRINLTTTSGDTVNYQCAPAIGTGSLNTTVLFTYTMVLSTTTTYYLNAVQNSGGALTIAAGDAQIRAMRIA